MPWDCLVDVRDAAGAVTGQVATLNCIPIIFKNVIDIALLFAGANAVAVIIFAGIKYITSRGDPKAVESAKNALTWGIVGTIVIVLAYSIIKLIGYFTGATCIEKFGFTNCHP